MKKILLFILCAHFFCPALLFSEAGKTTPQEKTENFLLNYRFDPFQWVYPEYYYKADSVPVKKDKVPIKGYTKIEFYGLSAYVPEKYTSEITQDHDIMTFMAKTGEKILMIKATNAASVKVVVT